MSTCQRLAERTTDHLRTFWCKRVSLISLIPCNDSYNDSLYVHHSILILPYDWLRLPVFKLFSVSFPTGLLPLPQVTVGLPQMDRVAND